MKQLVHSFSNGEIVAEELPVPKCNETGILIESTCSLISSGTEKMLLDFGKSSLVGKAKKHPDRVRDVLHKINNDGIMSTANAVLSKLNTSNQIGYCNVGKVIEVGNKINDIHTGDRVISNGPHAEFVAIERNLCAKIPDGVKDEKAVFCVIGSIALQGIRLSQPTLGESIVVFGLGLVGQLTAQILKANGCRVLGIDNSKDKIEVAEKIGIECYFSENSDEILKKTNKFSNNRGVDAVILTLSSSSSIPIKQAALMCRKRGRIVLIGDTKLDLDRSDFYEKELSFQVSCSYGPGRYEKNYETKNYDYPIGFVRWTESRNFEAVLQLMSDNLIHTEHLLSKKFDFSNYKDAYNLLLDKSASNLGILLKYKSDKAPNNSVSYKDTLIEGAEICLGLIGSGNYAGRVLMPILRKSDVSLAALANNGGVNSSYYAKKFGFNKITTNNESILTDNKINTVLIATRHDSHAELVLSSLSSEKHIFCEKPLAISCNEIDRINKKYIEINQIKRKNNILMVGFNRRFSPLSKKAKRLIDKINQPKVINITINAGYISKDSWLHDKEIGGGRIVGEACHFIDLARYLIGYKLSNFYLSSIKNSEINDDKAVINLEFEDGSIASIQYLANGHSSFMKERIEIFCDQKIIQINNFKNMKFWGWASNKTIRLFNQNKGQNECLKSFFNAIKNGNPSPIPFEEIIEVSKASIELAGNSIN